MYAEKLLAYLMSINPEQAGSNGTGSGLGYQENEFKGSVNLKIPELDSDWFMLNFPFLTKDGFQLASIVTLNMGLQSQAAAATEEEEEKRIWSIQTQVHSDMLESACDAMEALSDLALSQDEESELAKIAIAHILLDRAKDQPQQINEFCRNRAAQTIKELSNSGLPQFLIPCLSSCLSEQIDFPDSGRIDLVEALRNAADQSKNSNSALIGFQQTSTILLDSLLLELERLRETQSLRFSQAVMDSMTAYPHPLAAATLDAIASAGTSDSLQSMARVAVLQIRESLKNRWDRTTVDKLSSIESRSARLAELCKISNSYDANYSVQVIFSNMKGVPIEALRDPRIDYLIQFLKHNAKGIQAAGCWSIFAQGSYYQEMDKIFQGIYTLADLAVNSRSPGLSSDAVNMIKNLQREFPDLKTQIADETEAASCRFVQSLELSSTASNASITQSKKEGV